MVDAHTISAVEGVCAGVMRLVRGAEVAVAVVSGHDDDLSDCSVESALVDGRLCEERKVDPPFTRADGGDGYERADDGGGEDRGGVIGREIVWRAS